MPLLSNEQFAQVLNALKYADGMNTNALPMFNWGASALDADAIQSLNEAPGEVRKAIAIMESIDAEA